MSRPKTYKVIAISLYNEDLARLDEEVARMKPKGGGGASRYAVTRSSVLRNAIRMLCDAREFDRAMSDFKEAGGE